MNFFYNYRYSIMNYYQLGQKYKISNNKNSNDQFLDWFNDSNNISIKNMGGIRWRVYQNITIPNLLPSLIILFDNLTKKGTPENPWSESYFDEDLKTLQYPGDAKKNSKKKFPHEFVGNKQLLKCRDTLLQGNQEYIPPILFFKIPQAGWAQFCGLYKFENIHDYFDGHAGVENYMYECSKINLERVSVNWLRDRALCSDFNKIDISAPKEWIQRSKIIDFNSYLKSDLF